MSDVSAPSAPGARKVSARRAGVVVAAVLAATGVFFAWQSWPMTFVDFGVPGPGLFPFVLGVVLVCGALAIMVEELSRKDHQTTIEVGHRDVLVVFAALVVVAALFETAGAYATLGLVTAVLLKMLARVSIVTAVASAAVGMVLVWFAFKVVLGVQLPVGPL